LRASLFEQEKADGAAHLDPEIARLSYRLSVLETDIELFRDARSLLIHDAIAQVGRSLSKVLQNFRACQPGGTKPPTLTPRHHGRWNSREGPDQCPLMADCVDKRFGGRE